MAQLKKPITIKCLFRRPIQAWLGFALVLPISGACHALYHWQQKPILWQSIVESPTLKNMNFYLQSLQSLVKEHPETVPPGTFLDLGLYAIAAQDLELAKHYFNQEVILFPASKDFVRLIESRMPQLQESTR